MKSSITIAIAFFVTAVGAFGLYNPGGSDFLPGLNLFLGGLLFGLGWAQRQVEKIIP